MFDNEILQPFRIEGDKVLDQHFDGLTSATIFSCTPNHLGKVLLEAWHVQTSIGKKIKENRELKSAQKFYAKHRAHILFTLGFMSLPYCYAAAAGAQVMYFSDKMRNQPLKRLKDTASFVESVCSPDSSVESIDFSIRQVRWKHAQVRAFMKQQTFWNSDWGLPVNQEDLAGTNLAFSVVVLRGLRKLNIPVSPEEAAQFYLLWTIIGEALGIEKLLLPSSLKQSLELEKAIKTRHFIKNEQSVWLTKSLVSTLNKAMGFDQAEKIMGSMLEPDVVEVLSLQPDSFDFIQQTFIHTFLRWKSF